MYIPLQKFKFWCQKVLPLVYDNSLSYYEVLCKVTKLLNDLIENTDFLVEAIQKNADDIQDLQRDLDLVNSEIEKLKNGDYISNYIPALEKWIHEHIDELITETIKGVFFGLTDDGYFVAYIPDTWDDITFSTIISGENYGHLVLTY